MGHHLVDQSPRARRGGVDEVAGKGHLPGPVDPDQLGQADGHAARRQDAHPGVRVGEGGPLRGDEEVTPEGELQAARHRRTVDRSDDRGRGVPGQAASHDRGAAAVGTPRPGRGGHVVIGAGQVRQVEAGAEGRVPTRQHDRGHVRVGVGVGQGRPERGDHRSGQGVAGLRAVEDDEGDGATAFGGDHAHLSTTAGGPGGRSAGMMRRGTARTPGREPAVTVETDPAVAVLGASAYVDPVRYGAERLAVFAREWTAVGTASQVADAGLVPVPVGGRVPARRRQRRGHPPGPPEHLPPPVGPAGRRAVGDVRPLRVPLPRLGLRAGRLTALGP